MKLLEQVKLHKELSKKIEELEAQKKLLGSAIMEHMEHKILNLPGFLVRRYHRFSYNIPLEEAIALKATKVKEVVDIEQVKALHLAGHSIEGIKEIQYITVTETLP